MSNINQLVVERRERGETDRGWGIRVLSFQRGCVSHSSVFPGTFGWKEFWENFVDWDQRLSVLAESSVGLAANHNNSFEGVSSCV